MRRVAFGGALCAGLVCAAAQAGAPAKFTQVPPEEFRPLDLAMVLETGAASERSAETFDLAAGIELARCPSGAWTGRAVYQGHAGGTVEWEGRFWRCFPFGQGRAVYPNGTRYDGVVNSYLRNPSAPGLLIGAGAATFRLDAASVRVAVREGRGSFTRADGTVLQAEFLAGEPLDPKDIEDEQRVRLSSFAAALTVLDEQQRQAEALQRRTVAMAKAAEEKRAADEQRQAEEARQAAARAEAERLAAQQARVAGFRSELAGSSQRLIGAVPWVASAAAVGPGTGGTDPATCWVDAPLLQEWVAAVNAHNLNSGFRQVGPADAEQRFKESLRYITGSSPEDLRALVQRDDAYYAQVGTGAHAIGLVQIGQEQARASYAEHRILRALRVCVADRKENAARASEAERVAAQQRQAAALGAAAASAANDPAAKACVDSYANQEKYFDAINRRRPADVDLIAEFQTVIYMLETRLALLDKVCRDHALYSERPSVAQALARAGEACRAHAVAADLCHGDIAW